MTTLPTPSAPPAADHDAAGHPVDDGTARPPGGVADTKSTSFHVRLDNFDGPFDLLLQLISAQRMDITEVALHRVTDDFVAHIRSLGPDWDLGQATEFLVVAATLLDLKAARLLPGGDVDDLDDLALLESRDLLFARLLAYRAYQQVAGLFAELAASTLRRYPRAVSLEARYLEALPEVRLGVSAAEFAQLATEVFAPKPPPPTVSTMHIHSSPVSVAEHTLRVIELLRDGQARTFAELVAECGSTMEIIARFLGLLNLFRNGAVQFEQDEPMGRLAVEWTGDADGDGRVSLAVDAVDREYA